jgi:hypothetical protein
MKTYPVKYHYRCECGVEGTMWMSAGEHSLAKLVRAARKAHVDSHDCKDPDINRIEKDSERTERIHQQKRQMAREVF